MIRKLAAVVTGLILAVTLHPSPAKASWNACPTDAFCTWSNTNYWGVFEYFQYNTQCLATRWDVSSIRNNRGYMTYAYTNNTCAGTPFQVWAGQSFSPMPGQIGDNNLRTIRMLFG